MALDGARSRRGVAAISGIIRAIAPYWPSPPPNPPPGRTACDAWGCLIRNSCFTRPTPRPLPAPACARRPANLPVVRAAGLPPLVSSVCCLVCPPGRVWGAGRFLSGSRLAARAVVVAAAAAVASPVVASPVVASPVVASPVVASPSVVLVSHRSGSSSSSSSINGGGAGRGSSPSKGRQPNPPQPQPHPHTHTATTRWCGWFHVPSEQTSSAPPALPAPSALAACSAAATGRQPGRPGCQWTQSTPPAAGRAFRPASSRPGFFPAPQSANYHGQRPPRRRQLTAHHNQDRKPCTAPGIWGPSVGPLCRRQAPGSTPRAANCCPLTVACAAALLHRCTACPLARKPQPPSWLARPGVVPSHLSWSSYLLGRPPGFLVHRQPAPVSSLPPASSQACPAGLSPARIHIPVLPLTPPRCPLSEV
ncbi:hypothetical protein BS50DRAFT_21218 [Corynespora cassiicola Philippines]|uniref:Uncharacterized protein n=1 Tax=Corynespora cassiicola Philippines TaxID=1448308 RepID=A0A2T2PAJ0_CORCC|nr:hypothetical protein BS50DRAFT_21218 [Corynespora cassiicola Philippines]